MVSWWASRSSYGRWNELSMGMTTSRRLSLKMMMLSVSCAAASLAWIWSCLERRIWDGKRSTRSARRRRAAGGSAPQTASCLADHGVPTTVVAALGDDQQGDELRALLTERGIRVDETLSDGRTGLAVVPVFSMGRAATSRRARTTPSTPRHC